LSRRLARDTAFRALFQIDLGKCDPELALRHALEGVSLSAEEEQFVRELVLGAREKLAEIDALIRKRLINWDLSRVSAVERNLLRLALYEMLYRPEIPVAVSINEALELAKKYGTSEDAAAFINGVLDGATVKRFE